MISNVGRRRFMELDDRDDMERISLVPVDPPETARTAEQMADILDGRAVRVLDLVQDCGCIPDDNSSETATRNHNIIQDAITASIMTGNGGVRLDCRGTIYIDRSIWVEGDNITFQGIKDSAPTITMVGWCDPVLLLGIGREPGGQVLTTDHFPDAFNKLDSSGSASVGVRYGYKTKADSHISDVFGLPALGHNWWIENRLTVAFCYDISENVNAGIMFGLSIGNAPSPWYVLRNESAAEIHLFYRVADGTAYGGTTHSVSIVAPTDAMVHRVVFQLDLVAGTCIGFVDAQQVAVTGTVPSGATLLSNQIAPFHVNMQGPSAISALSDYASTPTISQTYYGIQVGNALRYRNDGVGQQLLRLDNGLSPNDAYLFLSQDADTVFHLSLTETPAEMAEHRSVDFLGGALVSFTSSRAFVMSPGHGAPENNGGNYLLSDMGFLGSNANIGQVIVMANTLYPTFRRVGIGDGAVALGTWGASANYTVKIEDCTLNATQTGLYVFYAIVEGDGLRFGRGGRATIRNWSSSLKLRNVFVEGNDFPECFVWTGNGGQTSIVDMNTDFEIAGSPSICGFYNDTGGQFGRAGMISVDGLVWGRFPAASPLFILDGEDTGDRTGLFQARRLYGSEIPDVYVEEHGVQWAGTLMPEEVQGGATPIVHMGGGEGGIVLGGAGGNFDDNGFLGIGTDPTAFISGFDPVVHGKSAAAPAAIQVESGSAGAFFHAKGATDASLILEDSNATSHEKSFYITSTGGFLRFWSLLDTYGLNTDLMGIARHGYISVGFGSGNGAAYATFAIKSLGNAFPVTVVRAAAGQTTNLVEWQDSAGTDIYGTISENGYWTTRKTVAPADAELVAGEMALWLDATDGAAKLKIKAKQANGTVRTGEVALA